MKYPYVKKLLTKLNQLDHKQHLHYVYNQVHFLYKPVLDKNRKLVVYTHGSKNNHQMPIFRGYNCNIKNHSILCLSDTTLHKYSNDLDMIWYLDTSKYKFFDIMVQIVRHIIDTGNYKDVIFYSSSAGSLVVIKLASIFEKIVCLSNAQLFLDKYPYYSVLKKYLLEKNDDIDDIIDVIQIFKKYGYPSKMIIYQNIADTHHYEEHYLPFIKQITEDKELYDNLYDKIVFKLHNTTQKGKNPHGILPKNICDIVLDV